MIGSFQTRRIALSLSGSLAFCLICIGVLSLSVPPVARAQEKKGDDAATRQYAAAAALQNREQYELATDEWAKFLAAYPQDSRADRATYYLGVCRLNTKQYAPAIEAFAQTIAKYPKFEQLESAYLYQGKAQYNLAAAGKPEMYAQAAQTFAALASKFPQGKQLAQALYFHGESLYAQGQKAEAAKLYDQFVKQFPQDPLFPDVLYALGVTQEELGQSAAAGATYATFLKQFPKNPLVAEVNLRRGETLFAEKKYAEAEALFAATAATPGFAQADFAIMRQADSLSKRKEFGQAAALYASVPMKFPTSEHKATAQLLGGEASYQARNYAAARTSLSEAFAAGGESAPEAGHWLARCYLKENNPAEALKTTDQALAKAEKSPYLVQLLLDRADALYEIPQKQKEAVDAYLAAAQKKPDDPNAPQALYMAGYASLRLADYVAAAKHSAEFRKRYANDALLPDVLYVDAESELLLGKHAEAGVLYDELLKKYPQHADHEIWVVRRGLCLFSQKKYAETVAALEPVVAGLKGPDNLAEAQYLIGRSQLEQKQYDGAIKALEASLKAAPKWRMAEENLYELATAYKQKGQPDQAKTQLNRLLAEFPSSKLLDKVHYRIGEAAYAASDFASAAREYQQVLDKWPQSTLAANAAYGLGWSQLSRGEYDAAVKTMDGLIAKHAASELVPRARYARGVARQQLQQFAPAADDLQAFLKASPTPAEKSDAQYVLGLCQTGLNQHAAAEATFKTLLKDDPKYSSTDRILYELGWSLLSQNKNEEAADVFARLAKDYATSPLSAEALYHVGEFHYGKEDFGKAATAYYDAMKKAYDAEKKTGNAELGEKTTHKLGWAYFRQQNYENAQQTFAVQRTNFPGGPLSGDAAFMEAESLFKIGKFDAALVSYEQVKNSTGKDFAPLALLHAGECAARLKEPKWDASLQLLQRAAKEFPDTQYLPEILCEQGWALQNLGKLDEALPIYESVTAKTNGEAAARARFLVGEVYFSKKNYNEAVRNYFKASYGYSYPKWQAASQYEAGECFIHLGKKEQARKSFQEVVDKYPDSDQAALAKKRLAALGQ
jgi:TolA-binding protein